MGWQYAGPYSGLRLRRYQRQGPTWTLGFKALRYGPLPKHTMQPYFPTPPTKERLLVGQQARPELPKATG